MKTTWIYWQVKHPVIYLPGISQMDKNGKEFQYTCVSFNKLYAFLKSKNLKRYDVSFKPMCRVFIFLNYLWLQGPVGRIGISTAWDLSKLLKANQ